MSIIGRTTNLELTQYNGSSVKAQFYANYNADMVKIDTAFKALEDNLTSRVDALDTLVQSYETRVSALEGWSETAQTAITDYGNRLDAIEAVIETVSTANIEDLIRRIDALEQKVDANTQNIDTLNANLIEAVGNIDALTSELVTTNANISALANRVTTLENCCEEVRTILNDHNSRINQNASNISALDARLTRDETNIASNASDITILATQNSTQANQIQDLYDTINEINPSAIDTASITSKGLTIDFTKKCGWVYVNIAGTLTSDIVDNVAWSESVPSDFEPLFEVFSTPNLPSDITNSLLSIAFYADGSIKGLTANGVTIETGVNVNCKLVYPCA